MDSAERALIEGAIVRLLIRFLDNATGRELVELEAQLTAILLLPPSPHQIRQALIGRVMPASPSPTVITTHIADYDSFVSITLTPYELRGLDDGQGWYTEGDTVVLEGWINEDTREGVLDLLVGDTRNTNWARLEDMPHTLQQRLFMTAEGAL
jgi:hypothetical protein